MTIRSCFPPTLALLVLACSRPAPPPPPAPAAPPPVAAAPAPPPAPAAPQRTPLSLKEFSTTDGDIAVGNLLAQLQGKEKHLESLPDNLQIMSGIVEEMCARGQYLGQLSEYDRALALTERMVKTDPKDPLGYLMRARVRSVFHLFPAALEDLDRAAQLLPKDEKAPRLTALRGGLLMATGRLAEALPLVSQVARERPDIDTIGTEAVLRGQMGQYDEARLLFIKAQNQYGDVSPFPVAWLYLQEGLMWEGLGQSGRARELYAAAHERLPAYATATAHLAAMLAGTGDREAAIALLRPLVDKSDDPEYPGQLAGLLREGGPAQKAEADKLAQRARTRYEALLSRHPEAFASHAARFYLTAGADPARAYKWAQRNLQVAATADAYTLALDAAAKATTPKAACELAERALSLPQAPARLRVAAARAFTACGQGERAASELQKVPAGPAPL